jgi:hypothetical protein
MPDGLAEPLLKDLMSIIGEMTITEARKLANDHYKNGIYIGPRKRKPKSN